MRLLRLAPLGALALYFVSACGGSTFTTAADGSGGAGGSGANDTGGSSGSGAESANGGSSAGGQLGAGGDATSSGGEVALGGMSSAGSGSGGDSTTGGSDPNGGSSGSGGKPNGGSTSGGGVGGVRYDSCTQSSQCTLVPRTCCGACEPVKLSDFVPINSARMTEFMATRACTDVACSPCPDVGASMQMRNNFGAQCVSGRCQAFDVRSSELSSCERDSDCVLRVGVACCEGCSGSPAAVSTRVEFQKAVCGDSPSVSCPECAPMISSDASPACDNGHCAVKWRGSN